jgi:hypothetical protein
MTVHPRRTEQSGGGRADAVLARLKERQNGAKGLPAAGGWVFLINDTNDFLAYQFGARCWTSGEMARVNDIMSGRQEYFAQRGIPYLMVITPEKSVVYTEWLPAELATLPLANERPAAYLAQHFPELVDYPLHHLQANKRHGLLFFRGDTHVNWLGAFHLYRRTIAETRKRGFPVGDAIPLNHMKIALACWQGDTLVQVPEALKADFQADSEDWRPIVMEEAMVKFTLHPDFVKARRLRKPDVFRIGRAERETVVTKHPNADLPRAVIFRDSTASLLVDLLAQHFSRAVFVWHENDVIGEVIEQEKPDIVLHFKAERFLSTYPIMVPVS